MNLGKTITLPGSCESLSVGSRSFANAGIAKYANLDELLRDPQVDMVDIALPTALHADVAVRALEAGKNVYMEKPMTRTIKEARLGIDW